ncbi:N-acetylmannosamine kinase [Actinomadura rubteroloni]|uniref:N-acetylmannosamine kinase n=1 Tax=Actinomadura rubteroloni TaxID=1926885 RepID=A0A2P4UEZ3_9ACTN|nr:ROK family protein [Actinomadura rubteroloni]POM23644.1 N-acetylmannosamine kinase [Actinomadura rubteroloni]
MPERTITVIDVGGTHVRWAGWSPGRGLGAVRRVPSPSRAHRPDADVAALRAELVRLLADAVPPDGAAGVSFGAALDHRTGTVYASAPLWGAHAEPFDLRAALAAARPDVAWTVVNDVTAALLHLAGATRDRRKIMLVTVSTGIACRTIDRRTGTIPVDGCGLQGEIGHLPASTALGGAPVALDCACGRPGHVAAFASGPGIRRLAGVLRDRRGAAWDAAPLGVRTARGEPLETAFAAALDDGDPLAAELLAAATGPVADVVRTALCLDPDLDLVAFTGGVAAGLGSHYHRALLGHLRREGLYLTGERDPAWTLDRIRVCAPGEADGLVGAGLAALGTGAR